MRITSLRFSVRELPLLPSVAAALEMMGFDPWVQNNQLIVNDVGQDDVSLVCSIVIRGGCELTGVEPPYEEKELLRSGFVPGCK